MIASLPRRSLARWPLIVAALLLVTAAALYAALPPVRRFVARPTAAPAITGITTIAVRYDAQQNHVFDPPVVRILAGTTLTWEFADGGASGADPARHDVVFAAQRSPIIERGSYQQTFAAPGTYRYVCSLHPFMEGVVEVE